MATERPNRRTAIALIVLGLAGMLIVSAGIMFVPETVIDTLNRVPVKATVIMGSFCLIAWTGVLVYRIYYLQTSRRILQTLFYSVLILGGSISLTSFGLIALDKLQLVWGDSKIIELSWVPHESSPVLALAFTFAALIWTADAHISLSKHEQQYGMLT